MIPKVRDDDPEDVSWALSTAETSFARGDQAEALKWLRRAAEAASEADCDSRAVELAKAAADLSAPRSPAPVTTPQKTIAKPTPRPAPTTTPAPKIETKKLIAQTAKRLSVKPPKTDEKRAATKSKPSASEAPARTDHEITATKLDEKPVSAHDADAWPTEAMGADDLDSLNEVYGTERTRIGTPAYKPNEEDDKSTFRASQAVHVIVWRDADGTLRIAPRGTAVSAVTIEALLVAPGPDVDLLAWLSPV